MEDRDEIVQLVERLKEWTKKAKCTSVELKINNEAEGATRWKIYTEGWDGLYER